MWAEGSAESARGQAARLEGLVKEVREETSRAAEEAVAERCSCSMM